MLLKFTNFGGSDMVLKGKLDSRNKVKPDVGFKGY